MKTTFENTIFEYDGAYAAQGEDCLISSGGF